MPQTKTGKFSFHIITDIKDNAINEAANFNFTHYPPSLSMAMEASGREQRRIRSDIKNGIYELLIYQKREIVATTLVEVKRRTLVCSPIFGMSREAKNRHLFMELGRFLSNWGDKHGFTKVDFISLLPKEREEAARIKARLRLRDAKITLPKFRVAREGSVIFIVKNDSVRIRRLLRK